MARTEVGKMLEKKLEQDAKSEIEAQRREVLAHLEEAKKIAARLFGTDGSSRLAINGVYDRAFDEDGAVDEEVGYLRRCVEDAKKLYGESSPETVFGLFDLIYGDPHADLAARVVEEIEDAADEDDDEDDDGYEDA